MAEQPDQHEKTEEPSQKKLEDAHKKGDVAKSQEVNSWFLMVAATIVLMVFSQDMLATLAAKLKIILSHAHELPVSGKGMQTNLMSLYGAVLGAVAIPFFIFMLAGLAGNLVQHRPLFSWEPVTPKMSKVSPLAGLKRLFSKTSLFNFVKSMAKLGIVSAAILLTVWPNRDKLDAIISLDPMALMDVTYELAVQVMIAVVAVLTVIAALDYAWQKHTWWEKQRMTVKELRDEYKQMEGDPQVRAKLRQVRIERGKQRMMQQVPRAAVVITNPTHYAIALEYEQGMSAPICVAKGVDTAALKIREIAEEHNIPRVENVALARALYAGVELEREIPSEHYKAVAEVIGYVMRLRHKTSANTKRR